MDEFKNNYDKGIKRRSNPIYTRLVLKKTMYIANKEKIPSLMYNNIKYRKINYVIIIDIRMNS